MLFEPPPEESTPPTPPDQRTCANCGAALKPEYRYCTNCGTMPPSAGRFCTRCGTKLEPTHRFCTNCGLDVSSITGAAYVPAPGSYPVTFEVEYPAKLSRLLIFVKFILAIPQYLVVYALSSVISVVTFISWFAILFTGRYPRGLFNLVVGFTRWGANVSAYTSFWRDEYPPFSMDPGRYPVTFDVEYPERLSRWLIFFKIFLVIPNQIVVGLLGLISLFVTFISWWAILFTGRYPRGLFDFTVGVLRWSLRATAYANLLRDEYPPYSTRSDAKPSGWKAIVIGAVVGILAIGALIGGIVALATIDPQTTVVRVDYEELLTGSSPTSVRVEGTRVVLTGAEDPYTAFDTPPPGSRFVAFTVTITNEDSLFTSVAEETFRLEDTFGARHGPDDIFFRPPIAFDQLARGERVVAVVVFEIDDFADPRALTYSPGFAQFVPFGERVRYEFR